MSAITKSNKFLTKTKTQADIGGVSSTNLYEKQLGSQGASSYTVFTLTGSYVPNSNTLNIFVNGQRMERVASSPINATQYVETSNKIITFGASLQTTDVIEFIVLGSYPVDNHTWNVKTYEYTMPSDGTTVTLSFNPGGRIIVYVNGIRQHKDAYSLSGTSVTFTETLPLGTKLLFITPNMTDTLLTNADTIDGYHSNELYGKLPNGDDSSIGPDLTAFNTFSKAVYRSINGGSFSSKTIVSTYALVYTTASGYFGGVLAPNGDIHFVPMEAIVGQKISSSGIVSTYSLVYTAVSAYVGGVLAPNGDIHFIPFNAPVGQKVSLAGGVSTYSLVYTADGAYCGGVLAPNGDIHFVPRNATVGQKVSVTGVVSTYSLVYTMPVAYQGGVLAPNGDIHFVPLNVPVGQKVSSAGVVSTYSLAYTGVLVYTGGVLAPNGDIHFVPRNTPVGQKISLTGVISTYLLVYASALSSTGGVLDPNGNIHFVPTWSPVGQKVSAFGVVSTYSLIYTTSSGAYSGGVLAPNGDIHFIPRNASVGQKISTLPAIPFSLAMCCSPFLNKGF